MTVRTRAGAQVLAPTAGRVAYSGPFRSYGIVLILDLDNDYAIVFTGMNEILVNVGQRVLAGQPIAEMAADATPAPELYVEVRRAGSPIDPARWLSATR
jgi:septal ring factor EnvC (AmiA/AmiB activator)